MFQNTKQQATRNLRHCGQKNVRLFGVHYQTNHPGNFLKLLINKFSTTFLHHAKTWHGVLQIQGVKNNATKKKT